MPLSASKIILFRKKIAAIPKTEDKLKETAKNEAKIILPVVTQVLIEIQDKLTVTKDQTEGVVATLEFVNYAIKILKETDERQQISLANLWNLRTIFADVSKERIENELGKMVGFANRLEITADTLSLWQEVGYGLEGLYKRVYDKVPKEKNGELKRNKHGLVDPVDKEDKLFNGLFHLTKFAIVSYYHQVYEAINLKINEYQTKLKNAPKPQLVEISKQPVPDIAAIDLKSEEVNDNKMESKLGEDPKDDKHSPLHVYLRLRQGHRSIILDFPDGQEDKIPQLLDAYKKIMDVNQELVVEDDVEEVIAREEIEEDLPEKSAKQDELPLEFLEKYNDDVDDIKLSVFICALDLYKLNEDQQFFLAKYKSHIVANLDAYINSKFTTWGLPTYFWAPAHIKKVEDKRDKILASDDLAENLKDLYDLLIEVRGDNSIKVRKRVTMLLREIYTISLRNAKPMHQIEKRAVLH